MVTPHIILSGWLARLPYNVIKLSTAILTMSRLKILRPSASGEEGGRLRHLANALMLHYTLEWSIWQWVGFILGSAIGCAGLTWLLA